MKLGFIIADNPTKSTKNFLTFRQNGDTRDVCHKFGVFPLHKKYGICYDWPITPPYVG